MDVLEQFIRSVSYKFPKGYPDMKNEQDINLLSEMVSKIVEGEFHLLDEDKRQDAEEIMNILKNELNLEDKDFKISGYNFYILVPGSASGPVLKKKQQLEDLGYETLMLMIYVSPLTSLERNQKRDRSLMPGIVLRTWKDVNKNIETYKQAFGSNFLLINNNPENANQEFNIDLLEPFLQSSSATGKPKTPEEQAKSNADKAQLNKDIESMVNQLPEFDSIETAKNKVNEFVR